MIIIIIYPTIQSHSQSAPCSTRLAPTKPNAAKSPAAKKRPIIMAVQLVHAILLRLGVQLEPKIVRTVSDARVS